MVEEDRKLRFGQLPTRLRIWKEEGTPSRSAGLPFTAFMMKVERTPPATEYSVALSGSSQYVMPSQPLESTQPVRPTRVIHLRPGVTTGVLAAAPVRHARQVMARRRIAVDRMVAEPRQRVVGCRAALNRGPDCLAPLSIKLHLPESTGCWCGQMLTGWWAGLRMPPQAVAGS